MSLLPPLGQNRGVKREQVVEERTATVSDRDAAVVPLREKATADTALQAGPDRFDVTVGVHVRDLVAAQATAGGERVAQIDQAGGGTATVGQDQTVATIVAGGMHGAAEGAIDRRGDQGGESCGGEIKCVGHLRMLAAAGSSAIGAFTGWGVTHAEAVRRTAG